MFFTTNKYYSISPRWIVRDDPSCQTKCSAYNIDTGDKYIISSDVYSFIKIFENNYLNIEDVCKYFQKQNKYFNAEAIITFIENNEELKNIFMESSLPTNSRPIIETILIHPESQVPVASSPVEAEIHFTKSCNLRCLHCVYDAGKEILNQINVKEWINVLDQFEDINIQRIIISGGEPLLYKGVNDILEYLTQKRMRIELLTNATLLNKNIVKILSYSNYSTTISLDGSDQETNDYLRGRGSFNNIVNGLRLVQEAKLLFHISTTVHKKNMHQIKKIIEYSIKFNASSISFIILDPIGRAKSHRELFLDSPSISQIIEEISKYAKEYINEIFVDYLDPMTPNYNSSNINVADLDSIYCSAGTTRIAIRSDGVVFPCVYGFIDNEYAIDSIKSKSIKEIWFSDKWDRFRGTTKIINLHSCYACSYFSTCTLKVCRLKSYYSTNDFYGKPPNCLLDQ